MATQPKAGKSDKTASTELAKKIAQLEGKDLSSEEAARLIEECVQLAADIAGD